MGTKSFPCQICHKILTRSTILTDHLRSHSDERQHQCSLCEKSFVRASDLKQHRAIHDQEPKYVCKWQDADGNTRGCGRRFQRKQCLKRHRMRDGAASCNAIATISPVETPKAHREYTSPVWTFRAQDLVGTTSDCPSPAQSILVNRPRRSPEKQPALICRPPNPKDDRLEKILNPETTNTVFVETHPVYSYEKPQLMLIAQQTGNESGDMSLLQPGVVAWNARLYAPAINMPLSYTTITHEVDTLWRVAIVAAFTFVKFVHPLFSYKTRLVQTLLPIAGDLYWQLTQSSLRMLKSMNLGMHQPAKNAPPDLLFAVRFAAHAMCAIALTVGNDQGAEIHGKLQARLYNHLEQGDRDIFGVLGIRSGAPPTTKLSIDEAADRYHVRLGEHFDTKTLDLFEESQRFLVAKDHPSRITAFSRQEPIFVGSSEGLAHIRLARQRYEAARAIVANESHATPLRWYDYTSV